ncbi:UNVERIFIED_CONTAM: hypothetical protein K2H54_030014 [Gekko kuhli]
MPGANGNLCKVCIGQKEMEGGKGLARCAANHNERYYGNMGTLSTVERRYIATELLPQLWGPKDLESSGWGIGNTPSDFELLCPDGHRAAIEDWKACNLGPVPPNIVMTRSMTVSKINDFLRQSQEPSPRSTFQLFHSQQYGESDLLFKDATHYLVPTSHLDYEAIIGTSFFQLVESVFNCTHAGKLGCSEKDTIVQIGPYSLGHQKACALHTPAGPGYSE